MNTIRWGIIGCGDVCEVKSGPGFQKATGSALVAVMRRDVGKAEDFARRHGVPRFYGDPQALIADPEVDAVYVATPPGSHAMYTEMAAHAGKPVYVEKPMATSKPECDRMVEVCARAGVPLFVAYYRRMLPRFVRVKSLLDTGAIGDVRAVTVTYTQPATPAHLDRQSPPWRLLPDIAGGGLLLDLGSHTLDLLDHLLGPIADVDGDATNRAGHYAVEDTVSGRFRSASGALGTAMWCFVSAERCDRVEIWGSRGRLSFATFGDSPVVVETAAGREEIVIDHPAHVHQPLIQTIVDQLHGQGTCPSTGESGARTSAVMDALLARWRAERGDAAGR